MYKFNFYQDSLSVVCIRCMIVNYSMYQVELKTGDSNARGREDRNSGRSAEGISTMFGSILREWNSPNSCGLWALNSGSSIHKQYTVLLKHLSNFLIFEVSRFQWLAKISVSFNIKKLYSINSCINFQKRLGRLYSVTTP